MVERKRNPGVGDRNSPLSPRARGEGWGEGVTNEHNDNEMLVTLCITG